MAVHSCGKLPGHGVRSARAGTRPIGPSAGRPPATSSSARARPVAATSLRVDGHSSGCHPALAALPGLDGLTAHWTAGSSGTPTTPRGYARSG